MMSPTDQTVVNDRHAAIFFQGYAGGAGSTVSVQSYDWVTSSWVNIGTATSSTSAYTWRGVKMYYWSAGSLVLPNRYWQAAGDSFRAQVRAISSDGFGVASLKPDWSLCMANTTTANEFVNQCEAATKPVATITTKSVNLTVYVDGRAAVAGNGTSDAPFRKISDAINDVKGYVGGPKRVEVRSGYYPETLVLPPGVDLVSPKVGAAIIIAEGSRTTGSPAISGSNDSSITGFVITGGHPAGISLNGTSTHVSRNIIRGNYGTGISCVSGCNALIENNTVIGQIRNETGVSTGISITNASPTVRNNLVYRQDVGIERSGGGGSESYDLAFDNGVNFDGAPAGIGSLTVDPGFVHLETDDFRLSAASPARHAGDPATFNADNSRADLGAFDGNGGHTISLAAQEWALESIFGAFWDSGGALKSWGARTPLAGNPTFWLDPTIANDPAIGTVKDHIKRAVEELSVHTATPLFVTGAAPSGDPCHIFQVTKTDATRGTPYLDSWVVSGSSCVQSAQSSFAGRVTGGMVELSGALLTDLLTATPGDPNSIAVIHETGHAYGGIYHCFRTTSPIAYGPQSTDYGDVEAEALALRAKSVQSYDSTIPMTDWFAFDYLSQAILHPFPAIESFFYASGTPPVFQVGTKALIQGSRFTMAVSSEQGGSDKLPADYAAPTVYFNDVPVAVVLATNWYGGPTRNVYVTPPAAAKSGWLTVRARGVESIPVWVTVNP
jgi:hypothetical protein